jgi:hypothetical protein
LTIGVWAKWTPSARVVISKLTLTSCPIEQVSYVA